MNVNLHQILRLSSLTLAYDQPRGEGKLLNRPFSLIYCDTTRVECCDRPEKKTAISYMHNDNAKRCSMNRKWPIR